MLSILGPLRSARTVHPPLFAFVATLALLTLFFIAGIFLDSRVITGAPAWMKPAKFGISISLYCLTLLWILGTLPRDRRWKNVFVRATGWIVLGVFVLEIVPIVIQVIRGTTSHFNWSTPFDTFLFSVMGASIVTLMVLNLVVAVVLLFQRLGSPLLSWGIRLGVVISVVGMGLGFLMTDPTAQQMAALEAGETVGILGAHSVGVPDGGPGLPFVGWSTEGGDLRIGHFVGMHALQVLPLLAIALAALGGALRRRLATLAIAATAYLGVTLLVTWQALRAQPLLRPDALTLGVAGALLGATLLALAITWLPVFVRRGSSAPLGVAR